MQKNTPRRLVIMLKVFDRLLVEWLWDCTKSSVIEGNI